MALRGGFKDFGGSVVPAPLQAARKRVNVIIIQADPANAVVGARVGGPDVTQLNTLGCSLAPGASVTLPYAGTYAHDLGLTFIAPGAGADKFYFNYI